jgi:hypothetical protein
LGDVRKEELARLIESGEYEVDLKEVAAAMLRRNPSMLIPREPVDRPPAGVDQDEPAPDADVA